LVVWAEELEELAPAELEEELLLSALKDELSLSDASESDEGPSDSSADSFTASFINVLVRGRLSCWAFLTTCDPVALGATPWTGSGLGDELEDDDERLGLESLVVFVGVSGLVAISRRGSHARFYSVGIIYVVYNGIYSASNRTSK
jgi:hypothetical protein